HGRRLCLVALVHMPLAEEFGIDAATASTREASERRSLANARLVVVTGRATAKVVARYGVGSDRLALVEPGTDPAPVSRGSESGTLRLLCVAALTPGKGHDVLISALARVKHLDWTLECAGSLLRHPETVARLKDLLRAKGLHQRVSLAGELNGVSL